MGSPDIPPKPRWYAVPARALFVTLLLTLLSFALTLLVTIISMMITAAIRGTSPDMRFAYRHVALPVAIVVGVMVLVVTLVTEIRHYRQSQTLDGIARASR